MPGPGDRAVSPESPVREIEPEGAARAPEHGIALCFSGGGYRAMVFHVGVLWRLNEAGYLSRLARVSSVSGGSITSGLLGMKWGRLAFNGAGVAQAFRAEIVDPIRGLAGRTLDAGAIATGVLLPGVSVGDALPCPFDRTTELANIPTRLARMEAAQQERLINWGYAVCDAALRRHVQPTIPRPAGFPYPGTGV